MRRLAAESPNFSDTVIQPEFVVLHYTACEKDRALAIFADRSQKVCAHFVLDTNGDLYDLGNFWDGPILQGAHAGDSHFSLHGQRFERLNTVSVGIEIVNLNGNLFAYPEAQYVALEQILTHLGKRFPQLANPERIIGHEHIAGFRGKVDPGFAFDWRKLFQLVFGNRDSWPDRPSTLNAEDVKALKSDLANTPTSEQNGEFWSEFSARLERKFGRKT